jgi:glycosyltransferase involved in cell wall biosynthesis
MKIVVSAAYPEGATMAVARQANRQGSLEVLFTSASTRHVAAIARAAGLPGQLSLRLARHAYADIPEHRVHVAAPGAGLLAMGLRHLPMTHALASQAMYAGKARFDKDVAARSPRSDAFVGIVGSSALSFARAPARVRVLQFVNSLPQVQNTLLEQYGGAAPRHEFVPEWVTRRVGIELRLADLVLVPSVFVADQLSRGGSAEKVRVVPYGVDLGAFSASVAVGRRGPVRCLFVGQISHRKGVHVLLEAARLVGPSVVFELCGPVVSPGLLRDLPENVSWIGSAPHVGVSTRLRQADIFVLPSVEDAYPLAVLEAMASSRPVIVTTAVGTSDLVAQSGAGLVVAPGDALDLSHAVQILSADEELRARLGLAARRAVANTYSWEQYSVRVLDMITEAVVATA